MSEAFLGGVGGGSDGLKFVCDLAWGIDIYRGETLSFGIPADICAGLRDGKVYLLAVTGLFGEDLPFILSSVLGKSSDGDSVYWTKFSFYTLSENAPSEDEIQLYVVNQYGIDDIGSDIYSYNFSSGGLDFRSLSIDSCKLYETNLS